MCRTVPYSVQHIYNLGKIAKPGGPRPDRLQNPVVFDILQNPVVRVSLQNPVVNGLFAKPGGPRPTDSTICVYFVRLRQWTHKFLLLNANAAFNSCTRTVLYEYIVERAACCAAEVLYSQVRHLPPAYKRLVDESLNGFYIVAIYIGCRLTFHRMLQTYSQDTYMYRHTASR